MTDPAGADGLSPDVLRRRIRELMPRAKDELAALVTFKSVADPRQFPAEECLNAARFLIDAFTDVGIGGCRLLDIPDGHPAVFGHTPGPPGAPTVLLYSHYDVQPPLDDAAWTVPAWELTEKGGRWYGRGTADCKGNIVAHLAALRALEVGGSFPVGIKLLAEGAEEQGTGGLEEFVAANGELLSADAVLVCDTGNAAVGVPTLTTTLRGTAEVLITVTTMSTPMHSGMFGGPSPDALTALIHALATLHDDRGNVTIKRLATDQKWDGVDYDPQTFRKDATILDGVDLAGDGEVSDMLWARPAVSVLGMDVPPVVGSASLVQATARARVSLRIPPGLGAQEAQRRLADHLRAAVPWHARVDITTTQPGEAFAPPTNGPAYRTMMNALATAYGRPTTTAGQGGSIPLCNVFGTALPGAEVILMGVEEPLCRIHAPNESVDPSEIEHIALAEALFLQDYPSEKRT